MKNCVSYCFAVLMVIHAAPAAKILLLPTMIKSHVFELQCVGEELVNRGHHVSVYLPVSFDTKVLLPSINVITYNVPDEYMEMFQYGLDRVQSGDWITDRSKFEFMFTMKSLTNGLCWGLYADKKGMDQLKEERFDLAIVMTLPFTQCLYYLPYYLNIPTVAESTTILGIYSRTPLQSNTVPYALHPYGSDMTLFQRYANSFMHILSYFILPYAAVPDMSRYDSLFSNIDVNNLVKQALLYLENTDNIFDYPKANFPNFVNVGGLTAKPPKAISKTLENFVARSSKGVILVSFGSVAPVQFAPKSMIDNLLTALHELEYTVLMKSDSEYEDANIKFSKWLPQNDILGHSKTILFISHCGKNGLYESLYHGVPILCSPRAADQPMNAIRVEELGIGIHKNFQWASVTEISQAIHECINNQTYRENMQRLSRLFRDRPERPAQRAASAIEHVIKYGSDHMTPPSRELSTLQYIGADIWFVIYFLLFTSVFIIYKCCHKLTKTMYRLTKFKTE